MNPKLIIQKLAITTLLFGLSGCANISLLTAWSLRDVDYTRVDVRQLRLALALPKGALLDEATVSLKFSTDTGVNLDHLIYLGISELSSAEASVAFPLDLATRLVFKIPQDQISLVENYQKQLGLAQSGGIKGSASFGIGSRLNQVWLARYCQNDGPNNTPPRSLPMQAWIQVDEAQGFLKILEEDAMFKMLSRQGQGICESGV